MRLFEQQLSVPGEHKMISKRWTATDDKLLRWGMNLKVSTLLLQGP
jgi:hypothetical protein